jgi:hypothetical protein
MKIKQAMSSAILVVLLEQISPGLNRYFPGWFE